MPHPLLAALELTRPADKRQLLHLEATLGRELPKDYRGVLLESDGGEGPLGEHGWLRLYPLEQLLAITAEYGLEEHLPGYLLIGTDGGDAALALNLTTEPAEFVTFSFIGFGDPDEHRCLGPDFFQALSSFAVA